jgi:acetyl esterase/lipase
MTSRHLVDPDLAAMLDMLPSFTLSVEDLPTIRSDLLATMAASAPPPDPGTLMTVRTIPGPPSAPAVPLFIYRPAAKTGTLPVLLHFHGGGHVMGAPSIRDARSRYLARTVECAVVSVQYRLSPENPFPAALDDAYAALAWVHANTAELGVDGTRIAIAGESAGGGLAASLAQLARDRAEISIALQLLSYPMLDNRTGRSIDRGGHSGEFIWNAESNRFAWDALLGNDHPVDDPRPYAVPGRCMDLSGLPPTFIAVGALDLFAEEDLDYARRLVHAGVPTELHLYPGAFHAFDSAPGAWSAQSFQSHQLSALRRALHPAAHSEA